MSRVTSHAAVTSPEKFQALKFALNDCGASTASCARSRAELRLLPAGWNSEHDEIARAIGHDRVVAADLLVIVQTEAWLDRERIRQLVDELAEDRGAGVLEADVVVRGQPVEHAGIA
jgi:hypothetical protein